MTKLPARMLIVASAVSLFVTLAFTQENGSITGTVFDEDGQAFGQGWVCISAASADSARTVCSVHTDNDGTFRIENVSFGTYGLLASNEDLGYTIVNQSPGQQVSVTEANPTPNVSIHMRAKGGIVVATVKDKASGEEVKGATIQFQAVGSGPACARPASSAAVARGNSGEIQFVVPARCDLRIVVSCPEYKE